MARDPITGSKVRWRYEDGTTKGQEFEHTFAPDGTVSWTMKGATAAAGPNERAHYEVASVAPDVWLVAYLAPSGWTLTTTLDMAAKRIVSIASNEKQLFVQSGTFEVVTPAKSGH